MPLECWCGEWDPEPGDHTYHEPFDYSTYTGIRRKRCMSCKQVMIAKGDLCLRWQRFRVPATDVEILIWGEDGLIPLAEGIMCETCGDMYFNFKALKFCVHPDENMRELLKEYQEMSTTQRISAALSSLTR